MKAASPAMKERPILFSGAMVRAILDGRKTQTRRAVKGMAIDWLDNVQFTPEFVAHPDNDMCPFGKIGDGLWVRETHAIVPRTAFARSDGVQQILRPNDNHDAAVFREGWARSHPGRWRPSIHMPRWASRITLEITDVRVERLQDISEEDAEAEGIQQYKGSLRWVRHLDAVTGEAKFNSAKDAFRGLWQYINGPDSWDLNPWVWAITFKRVK